MRLSRFFGVRGSETQRDGQAEELVAQATGITPDFIDGALASPSAIPESAIPGSAIPGSAIPNRRQRPLPSPRAVVMESLSEKVLYAWMQNRHQTLYPLTVNLRTLAPGQPVLLAQVMATALLAGAGEPDPAHTEAAAGWLTSAGAGPEVVAALHEAIEQPVALRLLLRDVQQGGLAAYAYVAALIAAPARDPAGQPFLDYLAARLALPAEVVRSANRRYRQG